MSSKKDDGRGKRGSDDVSDPDAPVVTASKKQSSKDESPAKARKKSRQNLLDDSDDSAPSFAERPDASDGSAESGEEESDAEGNGKGDGEGRGDGDGEGGGDGDGEGDEDEVEDTSDFSKGYTGGFQTELDIDVARRFMELKGFITVGDAVAVMHYSNELLGRGQSYESMKSPEEIFDTLCRWWDNYFARISSKNIRKLDRLIEKVYGVYDKPTPIISVEEAAMSFFIVEQKADRVKLRLQMLFRHRLAVMRAYDAHMDPKHTNGKALHPDLMNKLAVALCDKYPSDGRLYDMVRPGGANNVLKGVHALVSCGVVSKNANVMETMRIEDLSEAIDLWLDNGGNFSVCLKKFGDYMEKQEKDGSSDGGGVSDDDAPSSKTKTTISKKLDGGESTGKGGKDSDRHKGATRQRHKDTDAHAVSKKTGAKKDKKEDASDAKKGRPDDAKKRKTEDASDAAKGSKKDEKSDAEKGTTEDEKSNALDAANDTNPDAKSNALAAAKSTKTDANSDASDAAKGTKKDVKSKLDAKSNESDAAKSTNKDKEGRNREEPKEVREGRKEEDEEERMQQAKDVPKEVVKEETKKDRKPEEPEKDLKEKPKKERKQESESESKKDPNDEKKESDGEDNESKSADADNSKAKGARTPAVKTMVSASEQQKASESLKAGREEARADHREKTGPSGSGRTSSAGGTGVKRKLDGKGSDDQRKSDGKGSDDKRKSDDKRSGAPKRGR